MTNKIEIATDETAEQANAVACIRVTDPLVFPDNIVAPCDRCGEMIQFRPHVPKKPPKICVVCLAPEIQASAAKGELISLITPATAAEVALDLKTKTTH